MTVWMASLGDFSWQNTDAGASLLGSTLQAALQW